MTTAYVLSVLRDFEGERLLGAMSFPGKEAFLRTYWRTGLLWLYRHLISHDMWWVYETEAHPATAEARQRTYCYTTSILIGLPEFPEADPDFSATHRSILERLVQLWSPGMAGIPTGPGVSIPSLEPTAQLMTALGLHRHRYPDLFEDVRERFASNLERILCDGSSDAAGWSLALSFLLREQGSAGALAEELAQLREEAREISEVCRAHGAAQAAHLLREHPEWVRTIAESQIFNVAYEPP